jgi:azurin
MKNNKFLSLLTSTTFLFSGALATEALAGGNKVVVSISSMGEQMKFDKNEVKVPAGSDVTVIFNNKSTALKHNWILTKKGKGDAVATAGMSAGESKGYVTKGGDVIAFTKLIDPNKKGQVSFKAPAKGTYDFVCTSPGHNMLMKGKFIVQ